MGLYFTKCTKCGNTQWFCSVGLGSSGGKPCKCDKKYIKPCDMNGKVIE